MNANNSKNKNYFLRSEKKWITFDRDLIKTGSPLLDYILINTKCRRFQEQSNLCTTTTQG